MDLTPKQVALVEALLTEKSKEAAAKKAKVPSATMHRWLKLREFRQALREAGDESLRHATAKLSRSCVAAADRLVKEMEGRKPSAVRIAAADKILAHAARLADALDARDELDELKRRMEDLERGGNGPGDQGEPPAPGAPPPPP